jgi:hypothetical protein
MWKEAEHPYSVFGADSESPIKTRVGALME